MDWIWIGLIQIRTALVLVYLMLSGLDWEMPSLLNKWSTSELRLGGVNCSILFVQLKYNMNDIILDLYIIKIILVLTHLGGHYFQFLHHHHHHRKTQGFNNDHVILEIVLYDQDEVVEVHLLTRHIPKDCYLAEPKQMKIDLNPTKVYGKYGV